MLIGRYFYSVTPLLLSCSVVLLSCGDKAGPFQSVEMDTGKYHSYCSVLKKNNRFIKEQCKLMYDIQSMIQESFSCRTQGFIFCGVPFPTHGSSDT